MLKTYHHSAETRKKTIKSQYQLLMIYYVVFWSYFIL